MSMRRNVPHGEADYQAEQGGRSVVVTSKIFAIFEGTSEIQRTLIGRTVAGLDVR